MNKYVRFDMVAFLKQSKYWKKDLAKKKLELQEITMLTSVQTDKLPSGSGKVSDPTSNVVARREKIISEIDYIRLCQAALKDSLSQLNEEEREIIDGFFFSRKTKDVEGRRLATKYNYNYPNGIYNARNKALDKMRNYITREYL